MPYDNLQALLQHSSSTRRVFLSLPVERQMALHAYNHAIHTAAELRRYVAWTEAYERLTGEGQDTSGRK